MMHEPSAELTVAATLDLPAALAGWTVIGLRASAQQAPLRRAARAAGAHFLSLPGLRLTPSPDPQTASVALSRALACPVCIFSSPAAVRFARQLAGGALHTRLPLAIGSGSAAALRRAGLSQVQYPPRRMHSEGLLALAALSPPPATVGLVTAPGGRGELQRALRERGVALRVAEVYRRQPARLGAAHQRRLLALEGHRAVLVSSAEALQAVHAQLPACERSHLLQAVAVCASPRLQKLAADLGFTQVIECGSTRPQAQLLALAAHAKAGAIR